MLRYIFLLLKILLFIFVIISAWYFINKLHIIDSLIHPGSFKSWELDDGEAEFFAFSLDGTKIITKQRRFTINTEKKRRTFPARNNKLDFRDINSGEIINTRRVSSLRNIAFNYDASLVASVNDDGEARIIRVSDGELISSFKVDHNHYGSKIIALSPDGKLLLESRKAGEKYYKDKGETKVWNTSTKEGYILDENHLCFGYALDGELVALRSDDDQTLTLIEVRDGRTLLQIDAHIRYRTIYSEMTDTIRSCYGLKFSPDGKYLAFSSREPWKIADPKIYVYDKSNGELKHKLFSPLEPGNPPKESPQNFVFSHDSRFLVGGYRVNVNAGLIPDPFQNYYRTSHGRIRIWDLEHGKRITPTLRGHEKGTELIVYNPESKLIVSYGKDLTVRFWKIPTYNYLLWFVVVSILIAFVYWQRSFSMIIINKILQVINN